MTTHLPPELLERAAQVATEVADLEGELHANLRLFAEAVREAGLTDPIGGLGDPVIDWSDVTVEGGVRFTLRDRDWDEVRVTLPAAWFTSREAGVEHERRRQAALEQQAQERRRDSLRIQLVRAERERDRLRAALNREEVY